MTAEVWVTCHASPNYEVSNMGRVRSLSRLVKCRGGQRKISECVLKPIQKKGLGYTAVKFEGVQHMIHRLVLFAFIGPPPADKPWAAHADGDRTNNKLSNLRWASPLENSADTIRHGRTMRGNRNVQTKLSPEAIRRIRTDSRSRVKVAADYGVTPEAISAIVHRKNWGWLD